MLFKADYENGCFVSTKKFAKKYADFIRMLNTFVISDGKVYVPFTAQKLANEFFEKMNADIEFEDIDEKYHVPYVQIDGDNMLKVYVATYNLGSILSSHFLREDSKKGFFKIRIHPNYNELLESLKKEFGGFSADENFSDTMTELVANLKDLGDENDSEDERTRNIIRAMIVRIANQENIELNAAGKEYVEGLKEITPSRYWDF